MSECIKAHREVHPAVSKYGKLIDKSFTDDLSSLATYFMEREQNRSRSSSKASIQSPFVTEDTPLRSPEQLLHLVIIEHLLRQGHDALATDLVQEFGFSGEDVSLDKFRDLSNLVSSLQKGELELARNWLEENREELGNKAYKLEYTLAKLNFLATMHRRSSDPTAVLHAARQLVPYAEAYPEDFEHLMGSLVFLGRDLRDTPYADLALDCNPEEPMQISSLSENADSWSPVVESDLSPNDPVVRLLNPEGAVAQAAGLFKTSYCRQLNLTDVDPLCTVFNSGCKLLSRQQALQRAISCLSKYSNMDGDTLPIAVELDPVAHKHNIFHCPVIKEVTTSSNGPVRLICGHAISRDAFESLPSSDRSKVKCPYCPMETYKNQSLDLIF
ncbi:hypothetical protein FGIG_00522 [Fasciola gigantica]|uniref:RING-Gid-type domain-containing protein n=1 Tax=Fasciola gigantica TaxID=46835 RepID=A0A504Z3C8_FASGI|nr:hypothetical protein FGIG_00522 [Fasciola gigantica]